MCLVNAVFFKTVAVKKSWHTFFFFFFLGGGGVFTLISSFFDTTEGFQIKNLYHSPDGK